jgi:hypothetical protein
VGLSTDVICYHAFTAGRLNNHVHRRNPYFDATHLMWPLRCNHSRPLRVVVLEVIAVARGSLENSAFMSCLKRNAFFQQGGKGHVLGRFEKLFSQSHPWLLTDHGPWAK